MNLLLSPSLEENAEAVNLAISCCTASKDQTYFKRLTEYLMGDTDGRPKVTSSGKFTWFQKIGAENRRLKVYTTYV